MKRWIKWLIIIAAIVLGVILFGAMAFTALGFVFDFMGTVMGWLASASRWLANLTDIFGFMGVLSSTADATIVAHAIDNAKMLIH